MISVDCKNIKGTIDVPMSKSLAHRYLICAFLLGDYDVIETFEVRCEAKGQPICDDVRATLTCLKNMIGNQKPVLNCGESGTTLRMLMPVVGALGMEACFVLEGSLAGRPIKELCDELTRHGMSFKFEAGDKGKAIIKTAGRLKEGRYRLPGNISSQYISGLIFAFYLIDGECSIEIKGKLESETYVEMTESVLRKYIKFKDDESASREAFEEEILEADWSSASMWLSADKLLGGGKLIVNGLKHDTMQGDACIVNILDKIYSRGKIEESEKISKKNVQNEVIDEAENKEGNISEERRETKKNKCKESKCSTGREIVINIKNCPDLAPAVALAALGQERRVKMIGAGRLRLKESDRLSVMASVLKQLGAEVTEASDSLSIQGVGDRLLPGSDDAIDCHGDHRMAMLAALSSIKCAKAVKIKDTECVNKSYPAFFRDLDKLSQ